MTAYAERQQAYELRRRARILGLAIDQVLTGMKNIIVHSNYKLWMIDDPGLVDAQKWINIKDTTENLLAEAMALERKLASMADIYASMIPNNPEATTVIEAVELSHPPAKPQPLDIKEDRTIAQRRADGDL